MAIPGKQKDEFRALKSEYERKLSILRKKRITIIEEYERKKLDTLKRDINDS